MKTLRVAVFCITLSVIIGTSQSIRCYVCSNCDDPFDKDDATVVSGYDYCAKITDGDDAVRLGGNGTAGVGCVETSNVKICYCDSNLCNGFGKTFASVLAMMFPQVAAAFFY